jgi:hypothetical protein
MKARIGDYAYEVTNELRAETEADGRWGYKVYREGLRYCEEPFANPARAFVTSLAEWSGQGSVAVMAAEGSVRSRFRVDESASCGLSGSMPPRSVLCALAPRPAGRVPAPRTPSPAQVDPVPVAL